MCTTHGGNGRCNAAQLYSTSKISSCISLDTHIAFCHALHASIGRRTVTPTPMPCARPPHGDEQCPCEEQRRAMSRGWLGGAWRYAIEARAAYLTVSP
jgi:hypothetical protein